MTLIRYLHALFKHNYSVFCYKTDRRANWLLGKVKQKVFVWQGKGDVLAYHSHVLSQELKAASQATELVRHHASDYILVARMFERMGVDKDKASHQAFGFAQHTYMHYSGYYRFMETSIRQASVRTGKEMIDFLVYSTGTSLRSFEYKLGESFFNQVYCATPVEELYDLFSSYTHFTTKGNTMIKPLAAGDICVVIDGLGGQKSPNIGKIVTIVTIVNRVYGEHGLDHRHYGAMYSCVGQNLTRLTDTGEYIKVTTADFAGIWLKRIEPPSKIADNTTKQDLTEKA